MDIDESIDVCKANIDNILDSMFSLGTGKGDESATKQDGGKNNSKNPHKEKMDFLIKALITAMLNLLELYIKKIVMKINEMLNITKDNKAQSITQHNKAQSITHEAQSHQLYTIKISSQEKMMTPSTNNLNYRATATIG